MARLDQSASPKGKGEIKAESSVGSAVRQSPSWNSLSEVNGTRVGWVYSTVFSSMMSMTRFHALLRFHITRVSPCQSDSSDFELFIWFQSQRLRTIVSPGCKRRSGLNLYVWKRRRIPHEYGVSSARKFVPNVGNLILIAL
jgi:hypothetical protein